MTQRPTSKSPVIAVLAACLALLFGGGAALADRADRVEVAQAADGATVRTVRMRFEARNVTRRPIRDASFEVLGPVARSASTQLLAVESSHPVTVVADGLGNQQVVVEVGPLPPNGTTMVTISAEVAQASEPLVRRLPRGDGLSPEPLIEVDDPRIASEAGRLRRQDAMGTARAVHDFVVAHVAYRGYAARERGAALALEEGSGDCSEMARLFVALARAAGVPARFVGGFMIDGSPLLTPTGYHDWAEFHDGRSWRIADPQQQVFDARYERYVTTRIAGPEVYETMTGAVRYRSRIGDLEVRMLGR